MKVGDYVRTKDGYISKIKELGINIYTDVGCWSEYYVIKSSPNIIDLIEVGDYVNGWRVNRVEREEDGTLLTIGTLTSFVSRTETDPYLTRDYKDADKICKIKSIVTHEQFSQMEYRIGE